MCYVMGIDPGTTNAGVGLLKLDANANIIDVEAFTLSTAEQFVRSNSWLLDGHNDRVPVMMADLGRIMAHYMPDYVAIESPFYNRLRPGAFGPLSEMLYAIKSTILSVRSGCNILQLTPSQVKTAVFADATGGKYPVKQAVLSNKELGVFVKPYEHIYSEHAIDAVAVAYAYLRLMREFPAWAF